jgi:hypothetical protein
MEAESELVSKVAELTRTKRNDVIKNALAVYDWFVRNALLGARVVARRPSGKEVALETPELAALESKRQRLRPKEYRRLNRPRQRR